MATEPRVGPAWTLAAMSIAQFMIQLDTTIVNVALPSIQGELHVRPGNLLWTVNAYILALASLILVGGTLGDRYSRRRVFLVWLVGFVVMSTAAALACVVRPSRRARSQGGPEERAQPRAPGLGLSGGEVGGRDQRLGVGGGHRLRRGTDRGGPPARAFPVELRLLDQCAHRHRGRGAHPA